MLIFADMENTGVYSNYMKLFFIVINLAPTHWKFRKKGMHQVWWNVGTTFELFFSFIAFVIVVFRGLLGLTMEYIFIFVLKKLDTGKTRGFFSLLVQKVKLVWHSYKGT